MSASLGLGLVFEQAGADLENKKFEKNKSSEIARPQIGLWQKIRVNPNYLVVFFTVATPTNIIKNFMSSATEADAAGLSLWLAKPSNSESY